jgi:hypothetical protein
MTTFVRTSPSDQLRFQDVYRLTLTAPSHWFETSGADSEWFGQGLDNIWNADGLDAVTPYAPYANPYNPGDLAETIDFLVAGTAAHTVANMLDAIRVASRGGGINFQDLVAIDKVEKIVGDNAIPSGTNAAVGAVTSLDAQQQRTTTAAAADQAAKAAGSWLGDLESAVGTAGKWVLIGGTAFVLYYFAKKAGTLRKLVS